MKNDNVFAVLGASGKVGGAAIRELRRRGSAVRAIVRDPIKAETLRLDGFEVAVGDVRDQASLTKALAGASRVLVICPMNPKADDAVTEHDNLAETIVGALRSAKPSTVVAISDYGAHHETGTGIAVIFHRFEQRLRSLPGRVTLARSAEQMQNWGRYLKNAAASGVVPMMYQPIDRPVPFVSAPDVGVMAAELLCDPNGTGSRVTHLEGPRRYSIGDVIEIIQTSLRRSVVGQEVAGERRVQLLTAAGTSESYARLITGMWDAHNAGRIEVEPATDVRRGTTPLETVIAEQVAVL
ncbi:MAG: NAD(P)H-binding protein [Deltaproteobacteria bacterium]|nr:NAD(P)H-binding protein [Deltaproteobacteria bacterium]